MGLPRRRGAGMGVAGVSMRPRPWRRGVRTACTLRAHEEPSTSLSGVYYECTETGLSVMQVWDLLCQRWVLHTHPLVRARAWERAAAAVMDDAKRRRSYGWA